MHLTQVALYAEDLARARAFYERLLGAPATAEYSPPGTTSGRPSRRCPKEPRS